MRLTIATAAPPGSEPFAHAKGRIARPAGVRQRLPAAIKELGAEEQAISRATAESRKGHTPGAAVFAYFVSGVSLLPYLPSEQNSSATLIPLPASRNPVKVRNRRQSPPGTLFNGLSSVVLIGTSGSSSLPFYYRPGNSCFGANCADTDDPFVLYLPRTTHASVMHRRSM